MRAEQFNSTCLIDLLKRLRAATMPEMKQALGTQVDMTVFRKLAPLHHITSYSHRGAYYSLPGIVEFDEHGLWMARGAWFSKDGTLLNTAEALVRQSPAGTHAVELESRLHVSVKDVLRQLTQEGRIHRSKHQGQYLYTALSRKDRQQQLAARNTLQKTSSQEHQVVQAAIVLFYSLLDEQQRRIFAGLESLKMGYGGDRKLAQLLGLSEDTVARGRQELVDNEVLPQGVRRHGGGRQKVEKKHPKS